VLADVLGFAETQLRLNEEIMEQLAAAQAQIGEQGDAILALSNRIETLTRAVASPFDQDAA